jgi:hypothetical protein
LFASTSPDVAGRVTISDTPKTELKRKASEVAEATKARFRRLAVVAIRQKAARRQGEPLAAP